MDASGTYFAMTGKCKTQWYDRSTANNTSDKKISIIVLLMPE